MKKIVFFCFTGLLFFAACRQNPENGGEEIRGDEPRSDTAIPMSNYPNEGDSGSNSRLYDGNSQSANPSNGARMTEGTHQDSQKTKADPLYKGDNSDTNKKPR